MDLAWTSVPLTRASRPTHAGADPGPLWLYAAPGSGVWLEPGRRMVAPNLVSAILRVRSMGEVLAHIRSVEVGDRRLSLYRAYV